MKLTVKQWIGIGIAAASVITEIVLVFTEPVAAVFAGAGYVLGVLSGILIEKKNKE